jgi:hypothetical protein
MKNAGAFFKAIVDGFNIKKDKTITIRLHLQEQSEEVSSKLVGFTGGFVKCYINEETDFSEAVIEDFENIERIEIDLRQRIMKDWMEYAENTRAGGHEPIPFHIFYKSAVDDMLITKTISNL